MGSVGSPLHPEEYELMATGDLIVAVWICMIPTLVSLSVVWHYYRHDGMSEEKVFTTFVVSVLWPILIPAAAIYFIGKLLLVDLVRLLPGSARRKGITK